VEYQYPKRSLTVKASNTIYLRAHHLKKQTTRAPEPSPGLVLSACRLIVWLNPLTGVKACSAVSLQIASTASLRGAEGSLDAGFDKRLRLTSTRTSCQGAALKGCQQWEEIRGGYHFTSETHVALIQILATSK